MLRANEISSSSWKKIRKPKSLAQLVCGLTSSLLPASFASTSFKTSTFFHLHSHSCFPGSFFNPHYIPFSDLLPSFSLLPLSFGCAFHQLPLKLCTRNTTKQAKPRAV